MKLRLEKWLLFASLIAITAAAWQDNVRAKKFVKSDLLEEDEHPSYRFPSTGRSNDTSKIQQQTLPQFINMILQFDDYLIVAARDRMFNISVANLSLVQTLEWPSTRNATETCLMKGKSEEECHNFFKVITKKTIDLNPIADERNKNQTYGLAVCGTNAFKPTYREYDIKDGSYSLMTERNGLAICPHDPRHNSTFLYVDNQLYAATVTDFASIDAILYREPLQTAQYDVMSFNSPQFAGSLALGEHVFLFFREMALEHTNCGKTVFSRVGRVCKKDEGGNKNFRNKWTSYFKARLNCSVPGETPFYFDEIQSISGWIGGRYGSESATLVYAVFNTPVNSPSGSAVCAYSIRDISDTFEGNFKEQKTDTSNWLPVPLSNVPDPRPGQCVNNSKTLPDSAFAFLAGHTLMDEAVPAFFKQPIFIRTGVDYRFTKIVVDPQIKTIGKRKFDVIFIGTDNGRVIKVVNTASWDSSEHVESVSPEEMQLFGTDEPIVDLKIVVTSKGIEGEKRLIVASPSAVLSIPLNRCFNIDINSCVDCIGLQDPYCVWDRNIGKCRILHPMEGPDEKAFYQNVRTGHHYECSAEEDRERLLSNNVADQAYRENSRLNGNKNKIRGDAIGEVTMTSSSSYSMDVLLYGIGVSVVCALALGTVLGYFWGRKAKEDDINIPYPDTEYEYFEQRQNVNVRRLEPKMLAQEEVTYAEPVLMPAKSPKVATLRKHDNRNIFQQHLRNEEHFFPTHARHNTNLRQQQQQDHFGTLRSQRDLVRDGSSGPTSYRDGFSTTRSSKKVYL